MLAGNGFDGLKNAVQGLGRHRNRGIDEVFLLENAQRRLELDPGQR